MTHPPSQQGKDEPWWKKSITIALAVTIIGSTITFHEKFRIEPIKEQLNINKDRATQLNEEVGKLKEQNKKIVDENTQLRLNQNNHSANNNKGLALFSGYEVSSNLDPYNKNIAVGLILSDQTRNRIASASPEKIEAVVILAPEQEFVNLWVVDGRNNKISKKLLRKEGRLSNPERRDEYYFEILISSFPQVDPLSIYKIAFEAKVAGGASQSFLVKRVNLK